MVDSIASKALVSPEAFEPYTMASTIEEQLPPIVAPKSNAWESCQPKPKTRTADDDAKVRTKVTVVNENAVGAALRTSNTSKPSPPSKRRIIRARTAMKPEMPARTEPAETSTMLSSGPTTKPASISSSTCEIPVRSKTLDEKNPKRRMTPRRKKR